jgi:hypothetical protein
MFYNHLWVAVIIHISYYITIISDLFIYVFIIDISFFKINIAIGINNESDAIQNPQVL